MVGYVNDWLDDLKSLPQPKQFYDSMKLLPVLRVLYALRAPASLQRDTESQNTMVKD